VLVVKRNLRLRKNSPRRCIDKTGNPIFHFDDYLYTLFDKYLIFAARSVFKVSRWGVGAQVQRAVHARLAIYFDARERAIHALSFVDIIYGYRLLPFISSVIP